MSVKMAKTPENISIKSGIKKCSYYSILILYIGTESYTFLT